MKTTQFIHFLFCVLMLSTLFSCAQNSTNNISKPLLDFKKIRTAQSVAVVVPIIGDCGFNTQDRKQISNLIDLLEAAKIIKVSEDDSSFSRNITNIAQYAKDNRLDFKGNGAQVTFNFSSGEEIIIDLYKESINENSVNSVVTTKQISGEFDTILPAVARSSINESLYYFAKHLGKFKTLGNSVYSNHYRMACENNLRKQIYRNHNLKQVCGDGSYKDEFYQPHPNICPVGWQLDSR
jgi:hypothetical protein